MKLTPQPHAHSMQGQFEAQCLARGAKRGVLAIAGPDAYANPCIQAAWLLWRRAPFQSTEPFEGSEPFQSTEPFDNARWDNEDDGRAVVADWESEE